MKTLILYATKYGAAREIAQRIAKLMNDAEICDLKQDNIPPLHQFDCVIIGSSLYAGMIRKEAKEFASKNAGILRDKKIGLFLSGMAENGEQKYFSDNFPAEIVQAAKATSLLGGIFDPKKAGGIERFIMKIVTKQSGYVDNVNDEKIFQFAKTMKS